MKELPSFSLNTFNENPTEFPATAAWLVSFSRVCVRILVRAITNINNETVGINLPPSTFLKHAQSEALGILYLICLFRYELVSEWTSDV